MIGKEGEELDPDQLCHVRKLQHQQEIRDEVNSKLDHIASVSNAHSGEEVPEVDRPYGVEHEGQAYDVWYLIMEQVTDPLDIKKLRQVSKMFRDILRGKYTETRLPEIVKLILDKRPKYLLPEIQEEEKEENNRKITTFLHLRLISSQCKRSVEDIVNSEKCDLACLEIWTTEYIAGIFRTLVDNPIYAASFFPVNLFIDEYDRREFHAAMTFFLQLVGHRIKYFTYKTRMQVPNELYDCLRRWLMLMPNLTHLSLGNSLYMHKDIPVPTLEDIPPFPNLPLLQCFDENTGELPTIYVQRILEACPGISDLRLLEDETCGFGIEHSPQMLESLVHLTNLQLCPSPSFLDHHNLPCMLNRLSLYRKPLEDREFVVHDPKPKISSHKLFPFLKQFEETLEHLEFEMVVLTNGDTSRCGYLELGNLKTLKVELDGSFKNLNFLLYAEKLETLVVEVNYDDDDDGDKDEWNMEVEESILGRSVWEALHRT